VRICVPFSLVIDMDEQRDATESPWVRLHTVGNRFEADLLLHALEQEGILQVDKHNIVILDPQGLILRSNS